MKKICFLSLLAILAVCLALCGCGKDKSADAAESVPAGQMEENTPVPEEEKDIYPKPVAEDFAGSAKDGLSYTPYSGLWTVTLPDSWAGHWGCKEGDFSVRFFDIENAESGYGGTLFTLMYFSAGQDYDYLPEYTVLAEYDGGCFVASFPTDVQCDWTNEALTAQHGAMVDQLPQWLAEHFTVNG